MDSTYRICGDEGPHTMTPGKDENLRVAVAGAKGTLGHYSLTLNRTSKKRHSRLLRDVLPRHRREDRWFGVVLGSIDTKFSNLDARSIATTTEQKRTDEQRQHHAASYCRRRSPRRGN